MTKFVPFKFLQPVFNVCIISGILESGVRYLSFPSLIHCLCVPAACSLCAWGEPLLLFDLPLSSPAVQEPLSHHTWCRYPCDCCSCVSLDEVRSTNSITLQSCVSNCAPFGSSQYLVQVSIYCQIDLLSARLTWYWWLCHVMMTAMLLVVLYCYEVLMILIRYHCNGLQLGSFIF